MPVSFSQTIDLECPQCHTRFSAEVWLIVDAAERPDLWTRCREGNIHEVACPNGHKDMLDTPLLMHDGVEKRVLFLPMQETSQEEDTEIASMLWWQLHDALPPAVREEYPKHVESVSHLILPLVLNGKPQEEIQQIQFLLQELPRLANRSDIPRRVQLCEEGLGLVNREDNPPLWAALQVELGNSLSQNPFGNFAENIERAIYAFESALQVYTRGTFPKQWATTQNNLGAAYQERILGERAENLERAIQAHKAALTVYLPQTSPEEWASTQYLLGVAYWKRILGERAENLERAAQTLESVLMVFTHEASPKQWAKTQNNLGNVYAERIRGERAGNLERAIKAFESALTVLTPEAFPEEWATIQSNLGTTYVDRILGERAENLERAIQCFEAALSIRIPEALPEEWASTQSNLGVAYLYRIRGDRSENLEQAIRACSAALTVYDRMAFPERWVAVQNNLGLAYGERIQGERAENLEKAIQAFEAALTVYTRERSSEDWAMVQNNLSTIYHNRIRGERAENLEQAIQAYYAALSVYTREAFPEQWATIQTNLGTSYSERIRGERAENLEQAIQAYHAALDVFTRDAYPERWATIQNDLGTTYAGRIRGNRADNLEQAIKAHEAALSVYMHEAFPIEWARVQNNLGSAYSYRIEGDRAENLERAIQAYQDALSVYTRETFPEQWAMTQINLGTGYHERIHGERAENLEQAIRAYEAALTVYTRAAFPQRWAIAQNNLGAVYAQRIRGNHADNLKQAIQVYQAALNIFLPDRFPNDARRTARNLAGVLFELQNWDKAYSASLVALSAAERLYTAALTEEGKTAEIEENVRLYQQMVDVCLHLTPPRSVEAFLHAEEGRSRLLRNQLGALPLPAPANVPANLIVQETTLLQADRNWENAIRDTPDEAKRRRWVDERFATREQLNGLWDRLIHDYGASDYVGLRRGEKLKWEDVQEWLDAQGRRVALLEFFTLTDRLVAFVVRAGDAEPRVVSFDISLQRLADFTERFFREVHHFVPQHSRAETWQGLTSLLLDDVMPHLNGTELLYIIPHGLLHYLPLHALQYAGKPLIEHFPVVYAPSAAVAMRASPLLPPTPLPHTGEGSLVVGNPTGDLRFAEEEAKKIAGRFGMHPLLRGEATKARVLAELAGKTHVHLSTHAYFHPSDPFASGIVLADGILTAREVLGLSLDTRLLVVSACQTAMQDIRAGDELAGLARAFLYAGVPSLVLSLWSVNDPATEVLMTRFCDHLYDDNGTKRTSTAEALRAAMLETRKELPQTYYWAPFVLYGDWQ